MSCVQVSPLLTPGQVGVSPRAILTPPRLRTTPSGTGKVKGPIVTAKTPRITALKSKLCVCVCGCQTVFLSLVCPLLLFSPSPPSLLSILCLGLIPPPPSLLSLLFLSPALSLSLFSPLSSAASYHVTSGHSQSSSSATTSDTTSLLHH